MCTVKPDRRYIDVNTLFPSWVIAIGQYFEFLAQIFLLQCSLLVQLSKTIAK